MSSLYTFFLSTFSLSVVSWSNTTYHFLTDAMLSAIEEHAAMRVMLGFDKGNDKNINTGGKGPADYHKLLAVQVLQPHFAHLDLKILTAAAKNRVGRYVSKLII